MIQLDIACLIAFVILFYRLLTTRISLINVAHVVNKNLIMIGILDDFKYVCF